MMVGHHQKLMSLVEEEDIKSVSAMEKKFRYSKDDYNAVEHLAISDNDLDSESDSDVLVYPSHSRKTAKAVGGKRSREKH